MAPRPHCAGKLGCILELSARADARSAEASTERHPSPCVGMHPGERTGFPGRRPKRRGPPRGARQGSANGPKALARKGALDPREVFSGVFTERGLVGLGVARRRWALRASAMSRKVRSPPLSAPRRQASLPRAPSRLAMALAPSFRPATFSLIDPCRAYGRPPGPVASRRAARLKRRGSLRRGTRRSEPSGRCACDRASLRPGRPGRSPR